MVEMSIATGTKLEDVLREIAEIDNDFCGYNGKEYTSDKAREVGFTSDLDYHLSKLRNHAFSIEADIKYFLDKLFASSYYTDFTYEYWEEGKKIFLVVAWTTD